MTTEHGVPLSKVLSALSPQLLSLGTKMAKLEEVIGLTLSSTDDLSHDLIFEMQELDRIRQSILDMARLTRHLSEETVDGVISAEQISAIGKTLHLSRTKALLSGTLDDPSPPEPADPDSDVHLF